MSSRAVINLSINISSMFHFPLIMDINICHYVFAIKKQSVITPLKAEAQYYFWVPECDTTQIIFSMSRLKLHFMSSSSLISNFRFNPLSLSLSLSLSISLSQVPTVGGLKSKSDNIPKFPIMYPALVPGLFPHQQNQEQMNRGPGLYAVPVLPFMQPITGFPSNTLIPFTYNIPTWVFHFLACLFTLLFCCIIFSLCQKK